MTGRAGKRVDHSRQQKCLWRARGDSFHGDTRGFMLERIYRVPAAWKNVYDQYTDERALEDLASCARSGTLPWSHKVVRYDKLGIARPSNAVGYALRRYHGFDERDIDQLRRHPGVLPYDTFSALRNIRRERIGKAPRFDVSRVLGLVVDRKTSTRHYSSTHLPPRSRHRYDHRGPWTKAHKRRATLTRARIDRDSPVYSIIRNDVTRGANNGGKANDANDDSNNSSRPSAPPLPLPPRGLTPDEVRRFYEYFHFHMSR